MRKVSRDTRYSVDEQGNVIGPSGKVLKWRMCGRYPAVHLGAGNNTYVHHLVADAYLGPCPRGMEVLHKDDDPMRPAATNLKYGTHAENMAQAKMPRGAAHWNYKHGDYVGL